MLKNQTLLSILLLSTLASCRQFTRVETSNGVTTDRYTVDKENRRHGEFRRYFGDDTLGEISYYVHGILEGKRTIYNKIGTPEIEETYVNDILHGPYLVFYDNGDLRIEGAYDNGVMRGTWKRFYPGNRLMEEVTYEDNIENGPFVEYHENGNLKARGQYLDGDFEQDSLWMYDQSGTLERIMLCDRGICNTIWRPEGADVIIED